MPDRMALAPASVGPLSIGRPVGVNSESDPEDFTSKDLDEYNENYEKK